MMSNNRRRRPQASPMWRIDGCGALIVGLAVFGMVCHGGSAADDDSARIQATNRLVELGLKRQGQDVVIPATARISDDDITLLLDIGNFTSLSCYSTTLTKDGAIAYLSKAEGLRRVSWYGPAVTDDLVGVMARLGTLVELDLRGPFRGDGLEKLAKGPIRESLQRLCLRTDELPRPDGAVGMAHGLRLQAFAAIEELPQLRHLSLSGCGVTDESLGQLARLKNLRVLELDGNPIDGSGLKLLNGHPQLDTLTLSFCRLNEHRLNEFPRMPALRQLDVSGNQINDAGLATICAAELPKLANLYCNRTDITDVGLQSLRLLKNLQELSLAETRVDGRGLSALAQSRLRTLGLARTRLMLDSLGELQHFPHLRSLDVGGTQLTDDSLPTLQQLRQLVYLNVARTALSEAAVERLRGELRNCQIESRNESVFENSVLGGKPASD